MSRDMKDRREYLRQYYREHKHAIAARKAWQQKHDLDYRLRAILGTINQRCADERFIGYRWYGGKGVRNFLTLDDLKTLWERDGAARMKKPSIDREDADGDYEFSNCCFRELLANQERGWKNREERTAAIRAGMEAAKLRRESIHTEDSRIVDAQGAGK